MSDTAFLREILSDGEPHELTEIIYASIDQRGHGLTVHSRAAELRAQVKAEGLALVCERIPGTAGRVSSTYQLVPLCDAEGFIRLGPDGPSASQSEDGEVESGSAVRRKQSSSLDSSEESARSERPATRALCAGSTGDGRGPDRKAGLRFDSSDSPEQLSLEGIAA